MEHTRKGRAQGRKAVRPAGRPAAAPARFSGPDGPEAGPGGVPEDDEAGLPPGDGAPPADLERPSYGTETEEGRHIMELLEKHQEYSGLPRSRRSRPPANRRYEVVEHTADVGIRAFGETMTEAFENAALGMFNIITDPSKVGLLQDFEVIIEGDDLRSLLHEWLSQLLILSQVNGMLFGGFRVEMRPLPRGMGLTGWAIGEPADPEKHVYKTEIKAVTHHMLEVRESPPMVKVLFDI
ncbi:MAG: archease [Euryarchaeota archaeon]|nr:archease [Euryarchaeota archaeon]